MKNNFPFKVVDSYAKESYQRYQVVQTLCQYPTIEDEDTEGKLYATAFAYICSNYLKVMVGLNEFDDWPELVNELSFDEEEFLAIYGALEEGEDGFQERVWNVRRKMEQQIIASIQSLFKDPNTIERLFASIFTMSESGSAPALTLSNWDFFEDL